MMERKESFRVITDPNSSPPEVHLLSNGNYKLMITSSGSGYSRWKDIASNRWNGDSTLDNEGSSSISVTWIAMRYGRQDISLLAEMKQLIKPYSRGPKAEFRLRAFEIDVHTEIVISPEDDVELRSINLTNHSSTRRTIELTSYAEVVLTTPAADASHPAFSNLFVETEIVRKRSAIICMRRPKSKDEKDILDVAYDRSRED